jgi:hypothetical protein
VKELFPVCPFSFPEARLGRHPWCLNFIKKFLVTFSKFKRQGRRASRAFGKENAVYSISVLVCPRIRYRFAFSEYGRNHVNYQANILTVTLANHDFGVEEHDSNVH